MFKHQYLQMFDIKFNKMSNCQPVEVVGRGGETQLQHVHADDHLNAITLRLGTSISYNIEPRIHLKRKKQNSHTIKW